MYSLATAALLVALVANLGVAAGGWFDGAPLPLYSSSWKRHHLPYHPVARFRGADTRPYYPYEVNVFPDYLPSPSVSQAKNFGPSIGDRRLPIAIARQSGVVYPTTAFVGAQGTVPEGPMNAGELLALLFSGIRQGEPSSKMKGTLRFGIARR